jgi:hypothetical protein
MLATKGPLKAPSLQPAMVLAWALAMAVATGFAQLVTEKPAWRFDSAVHLTSVAAVVTGIGWTLFQLALHRGTRREFRRWALACAAMAVLGSIEATDWLVGTGLILDDWLLDLPLWLAATAMLRTVLRRGRERPGALRMWRLGMALQFVFIVCDLLQGKSWHAWFVPADGFASMAEWSELLAIESYVVALVLTGRSAAADAAGMRRTTLAVGAETRRIYEQAHLFRKAIYPPVRWAFWPGVRGALTVVASIGLVAVVGPAARRASGRSLRAQLGDLLALGLAQGFDPPAYYFQELYRPGGRAEAAHYLTRGETKNGLLHVLNSMRSSPDGPREMKDKVLFAACCRREGLPVPPTLLEGGGSDAAWRQAPREAFDRDLFCKLRSGRGARGALMFRRIAPARYLAPEGDEVDLDTVLARLRTLGRAAPLIVQPRLRNHPELADLADLSLVTVRVLTCLDADGRPVVTHALLRILSKLETGWDRKDEYGVPIDLDDGRLGAMASDRLSSCALRFSHHPVTGDAVEGRVLKTWPAISQLALAAHRAFSHRIVVGWDIAMTDEGPVLLEGNVNLDIMFPQRVYRQGIGRSPLGPLLQHHLATLAKNHDVD